MDSLRYNPFSHLPTYNPLALLRMLGFISYRGFDLRDTPDLAGKVAVITGGQAGIGREITAQLLLHGISKVYILARSESKYNDSKDEWTRRRDPAEQLSEQDVEAGTEFIQCDLSDIKDVKRAADMLLTKLDRLDILINNAALPTIPNYTLSPDNIETVFATNHLGHFALTNLLLPLLETGASSRIVTTTSSLHLACQDLALSNTTSPTRPKSPATLDSVWRYARSKLANILFTRELARRLQRKGVTHVHANCFFPGNIPTDAMDTWKDLLGDVVGGLFKGMFRLIGQSVTDAAATAVYLAASQEVEDRDLKGRYFVPIAIEDRTSVLAEDNDLARNLWYWSDHKVAEILGKGWQEGGKS